MAKDFNILFFTLLILVNPFQGVMAQEDSIVSVYQIKLAQVKTPSDSINLLNELSSKLLDLSPENSIIYARQALGIALTNDLQRGIASSYFDIGKANRKMNELDEALKSFLQSLNYYESINTHEEVALVSNYIGLIYKDKGDNAQALEYSFKAMNIYKDNDHKKKLGDVYSNIGVIYRREGEFEKAIEYFIKSLKIREESEDKMGVAIVNGNLGNLYRDQGDNDTALKYYLASKIHFEELGNERMLAISINNVGLVYLYKEEGTKALQYFFSASRLFKKLGMNVYEGNCLENIGLIYYQQKQYNLALENYLRALEIYKDNDHLANAANIYNYIGEIYGKLDLPNEAYGNIEQGLTLARQLGNKIVEMNSYETLFHYYEDRNEYKQALEYYKYFSEIKDSIYTLEKTQQIAEVSAKYEIEKAEQENEILRQSEAYNSAVINRQKFQNNVLGVGIVVFILFGAYYYNVNKQKIQTNKILKKQNQEIILKQEEIMRINEDLQKSEGELHLANEKLQILNTGLEETVKDRTYELRKTNKELDTFLYQSSHALRRPLVQMVGLLNVSKMSVDTEEISSLYEKLDFTANSMDSMLRKLVMASEINLSKTVAEPIDIANGIKDIWKNNCHCNGYMVDFEIKQQKDLNIHSDPRLFSFIVQNILENSINYCDTTKGEGGKISVDIVDRDNMVEIVFQDNGVGIEKDALPFIFEMFTVANHTPKGYGLGLYITNKAVKRLNGNIKVDSKKGEYTVITVELPKSVMETG